MSPQTGVLTTNGVQKKPKILCLHGGGTNATIFNIQTIRIQRHLSKLFDFVFLDAPFQTSAGPGVLPTFEGCEPFFSWVKNHQDPLLPEAKAVIDDAIRGKEDEFVAILGFSQGARLGAGLLLEQQLRQGKGEEGGGGGGGFKFGVFCMGTSPPLVLDGTLEGKREVRVSIPSIHFVGVEDPYRLQGEKLFEEHFEMETSSLMRCEVGHRLPVVEEETLWIVDGIKRLYEETTGKKLLKSVGK